MVKHYETIYPGAVEKRPVIPKTALPKVAQTQAMPEKGEKKKAGSSPIAIDNEDKSTYSVIKQRPNHLSDQENAVLTLLGDTPQLIDSVMDASELPSGTVQSLLTRLTIKGLVIQHPDGRISKK